MESKTVLHKETRWITQERCRLFLQDSSFSDVGLKERIYPKDFQVTARLKVYSVPELRRITYDEAIRQQFKDTKVGESFGPSWSTHWFIVEAIIPKEWKGQIVHFLWDSNSEALLWQNGEPLQAFTGGNGADRRVEYEVTKSATGEEKISFYIEMACNGMFGTGDGGIINPPDPNRYFTLSSAKFCVFDKLAFDLWMDLTVLYEMAKDLPPESTRARQASWAMNEMINIFRHEKRETWEEARKISKTFFSEKNGDGQHNIIAVGHCHIDIAWLWPYDETKRKAARSFATQIRYMDMYPNFKFAQSSALLYSWMKELYPKLYTKIKEKVKSGQFIPVGGSWIEQCGILGGGESHIRQFLLGQKFFKEEFGIHCTEFWLPDSFGYHCQLPQIMTGCKIDSFLTQKLSWNFFNKFPHSTFLWQGLDGSKVFSHFPPGDTYNDNVQVDSLLKSISNFKDKDRSKHSMMLFGHGDGGGGPSINMLERIERSENCDGLPKIIQKEPKQFFDTVKKEHKEKPLLVWNGELYMEGHRGTYTSQGSTKRGNRKGEFLLRDVEILSMIAFKLRGRGYPSNTLDQIWKLLLINQFHDVLPGSSIGMVYKDALQYYAEIQTKGNNLKDIALTLILNGKTTEKFDKLSVVNTLSWDRKEVVELPNECSSIQKSYNGKPLGVASAPSIGHSIITAQEWNEQTELSISETQDSITMENKFIKAEFSKSNGKMKLFDKRVDRVTIENGNTFVLHDDVPLFWDGWDVEIFHLQKKELLETRNIRIIEKGPLRVSILLACEISKKSKIEQIISLTGLSSRIDFNTKVEWHENRKMLKVQFPTTVQNTEANYEVQFGTFKRPTHFNTSWDVARFEVPAQKFADLSEYGYGIALLNDCKYGYSIHESTINLSLLRAPKAPDDQCDMGSHVFTYSIYPHEGFWQDGNVVQESFNLNDPLTISKIVQNENKSYFSLDKKSVIIESIKKCEHSDDIILRLYECFGGKTKTKLKSHFNQVKSVHLCNMLEEPIQELKWNDGVDLSFTAFQILTLKISN